MPVTGQAELTRRLVALGLTPNAIADAWSAETLRLARGRVRVRTGATRDSIRIARKSEKGARFIAGGAAIFLEKGTPPHKIPKSGISPKPMFFRDGGRTVFARKVDHPRARRHPFMRVSANAALRGLKREMAKLLGRGGLAMVFTRIPFQTQARAAAVTMLTAYGSSAGLKLQVYPARPRSIAPPTAFVDRITETLTQFTNIYRQRTPIVDVVVIHALFDSLEAATQKDAFTDGFLDWVADNMGAFGTNTK